MKQQTVFFTYILGVLVLSMLSSCKQDAVQQNNSNLSSLDTLTTLSASNDNLQRLYTVDEYGRYQIPWELLLQVKFQEVFSDTMGMMVNLPIFNDTLQYLEGKTVIVEGYYIPVDETGDADIVILSAYPFSQCFFCGNAGVESIIDIFPIDKLPRIKADHKITFEGRFHLNKDDFDYLIYNLYDAKLVE